MSNDTTQPRAAEFQRNPALDNALVELNRLMEFAEHEASGGFTEPRLPCVFILGNARSGTTLTLQWLAASGVFAYPTNLLSRFYKAPAVGTLVQKVLTDPTYAFRDELGDFQGPPTFESALGKTKGALSPHEFWYFWRRFFPEPELRPLDESAATPEIIAELRREFAAWESLAARPLAMKAMHMNFNVPFFARIFPRAVFLHIHRQPFYNMQSLLESRRKHHGAVEQWYSVKPPEFAALSKLDPMRQVAGQCFHTNRHITAALASLPGQNAHILAYESLCADPAAAFRAVMEKVRANGWDGAGDYSGPASFPVSNTPRFTSRELAAAKIAWREIAGSELHP